MRERKEKGIVTAESKREKMRQEEEVFQCYSRECQRDNEDKGDLKGHTTPSVR